jgi:gamma-glutamylcyclotransferase (GGCT)/AIG2-like uncharacterized protein YtfP
MSDYLFVYGTLRKEMNHPMYRALSRSAEWVGEANLQGRLYDLGKYPGAVPSKRVSDIVIGEIYA